MHKSNNLNAKNQRYFDYKRTKCKVYKTFEENENSEDSDFIWELQQYFDFDPDLKYYIF